MFRAFRVRKRFQWRGWEYAPPGTCDCGRTETVGDKPGMEGQANVCVDCTGEVGTGCHCRDTVCRCACGIPAERYAGDIWLVEEKHPRLEMMLLHRFAIGDASIPSVDDLLKEERYNRLLVPPTDKPPVYLSERKPRKREALAVG